MGIPAEQIGSKLRQAQEAYKSALDRLEKAKKPYLPDSKKALERALTDLDASQRQISKDEARLAVMQEEFKGIAEEADDKKGKGHAIDVLQTQIDQAKALISAKRNADLMGARFSAVQAQARLVQSEAKLAKTSKTPSGIKSTLAIVAGIGCLIASALFPPLGIAGVGLLAGGAYAKFKSASKKTPPAATPTRSPTAQKQAVAAASPEAKEAAEKSLASKEKLAAAEQRLAAAERRVADIHRELAVAKEALAGGAPPARPARAPPPLPPGAGGAVAQHAGGVTPVLAVPAGIAAAPHADPAAPPHADPAAPPHADPVGRPHADPVVGNPRGR